MGANDIEQNKKDDRRRRQQEKRKLRDRTDKGGHVADWTGVDGDLLRTFVGAVAKDGGAIRLGYTRDGGAYAVGIYGDGDPYTIYISPAEDIDEWLKESIEDWGV